jgi:hypothetical protein
VIQSMVRGPPAAECTSMQAKAAVHMSGSCMQLQYPRCKHSVQTESAQNCCARLGCSCQDGTTRAGRRLSLAACCRCVVICCFLLAAGSCHDHCDHVIPVSREVMLARGRSVHSWTSIPMFASLKTFRSVSRIFPAGVGAPVCCQGPMTEP